MRDLERLVMKHKMGANLFVIDGTVALDTNESVVMGVDD
jgi:hypothetical protein